MKLHFAEKFLNLFKPVLKGHHLVHALLELENKYLKF